MLVVESATSGQYTGFKIIGGPVARVYQKYVRTTKLLICATGNFLPFFKTMFTGTHMPLSDTQDHIQTLCGCVPWMT